MGALLRCCGSSRWAQEMADARPFASVDAMAEAADAVWRGLDPTDWLEAFAAHPRIGEAGGSAGNWSSEEQSGVADSWRPRFEARNRDYEARFGHIFIVCATGKRGDEMLQILERRMGNEAPDELRAAAEEQRKITRIRLARLLT